MSRRTLPVRRLAVAALAPLALTTLAACGDDGGSAAKEPAASSTPSPADDVEESGDADAAADVAAGEEIEPAAFMKIFEGAFEDATTVHMTMDMSTAAGAMQGEGDADYSKTPVEMQLTMSGGMMPGAGIETVMVDGVMYMKMPGMGADDKYFKLDLNDPDNPLGQSFTSQLDPKAMFEQFEDGLSSVVYQGEQDVDGDSADAYVVTVDAAEVLAAQGQEIPEGVDVPEEFSYTVYFADDLFRRMEIDMGEGLGAVSMDFTDWGKDVTIEAPPSNQVTDFPDLTTAG
ncbi:LppX_LprAFG lipoprotein [Nocardioides sp. W7]|uniref:LppX_LprAFG lipoprotein n=1 Tax=Nocardioides sp. W7 TaxID=2931390 RepID=UPI001FD54C97|nr:LppX_LprAFG lipoprotein [Nocardioides sp. W7]